MRLLLVIIAVTTQRLILFEHDNFTLLKTQLPSLTPVHALATPSKPSSRKKSIQSNRKGVGGGGFGSSRHPRKKDSSQHKNDNNDVIVADDELSKQTVKNLFSVCSHIQNPSLYNPTWADACHETSSPKGTSSIVASRTIKKGQVLTLFPIHALGLRFVRNNSNKNEMTTMQSDKRDDTEFVAYDADYDGEFYSTKENNQQAGFRMRLNIPLGKDQPAAAPVLQGKRDKVMFSVFDPNRASNPGWLGGRIKSASISNPMGKLQPFYGGNVVTIPLPQAAPLCAVVALKDIVEGEELIQGTKPPETNFLNECKLTVSNEYATEITELKQYIQMACPSKSGDHETTTNSNNDEEIPLESSPPNKQSNVGPFHSINQQYPSLKQVHSSPDVFVVDNFLSNDECNRIIAKASPHLKPCLIKNESTGVVEADPSRTSTNTNLPQSEAPSIIAKLTSLACCSPNQLEIIQILHYSQGQEFRPHTDGFEKPTTACGFENSNRLVTIFCYLNDVERGGSTYFPEIDLEIRPRKGMAVIHFPSDVELREDGRTLHQGMPAIDEKWLMTTWVWSKERSQEEYDESNLVSLSDDLI